MQNEKQYYRRYGVCENHLRALELLVDGRMQRFCQQVCALLSMMRLALCC